MEQVTIVANRFGEAQLSAAWCWGGRLCRVPQEAEFGTRLLDFLASQPRCVVAMEACAGAHQWGREIRKLGHEVRLLPPIYVKPFVNRQSYQGTSLRYSK